MSFITPLSYNPIPINELTRVLERYKDRHHQEILLDFEKEICRITGSPYAVALNSGTSAIHLGLKLLGVGPGDIVICPTFTYIASVNPVLYLGAEPVFVDCELQTWCMDPGLLEEALKNLAEKGKRPKAIVVVYAYGMPGRIDELITAASKYGVPVLEDAAEALGSVSNGRHMGTIGDAGVISFNNNKLVTTYGGGVLLLKTREFYEKVLFWATQSREDKPFYEHNETGYNYRMGPLNAAAGIGQLQVFQKIISNRRALFDRFEAALSEVFTFQKEQEKDYANRWLSTCYRKGIIPLEWIEKFKKSGFEVRALWNPMHHQPLFRENRSYLNGNADLVFDCGISLPSEHGDALPEHFIKLLLNG